MNLYAPAFGFTHPPFQRPLAADQLFRSPGLEELHSRLRYLVDSRAIGLLTGEPGSGKSTALSHLEALAQRISIRFALRGFDRDTTRSYLEHRFKIAGLERPLLTAPAHEALFEASQGIMRRIDTLAHHALAAAATSRAKLVEPEHILQAAEELRS